MNTVRVAWSKGTVARIAIATATLLAGAIVLWGMTLSGAEDEQKAPPPVVGGILPTATPFPLPDTSGAADISTALPELRADPAITSVLDAVENKDGAALLGLFAIYARTCDALGRLRPENCEELMGAMNGVFEAVIIDTGVYDAELSLKQAATLLDILFSQGASSLVLATTYESGAEAGDYLLAFSVPPYKLSEAEGEAVQLAGATLDGFGLRIRPSATDAPIVAMAPLGPSMSALQWVQWSDASSQRVIAPSSLGGFEKLDE